MPFPSHFQVKVKAKLNIRRQILSFVAKYVEQ